MILNQDPKMATAKPEEAFEVLSIAQWTSNLHTPEQEGDSGYFRVEIKSHIHVELSAVLESIISTKPNVLDPFPVGRCPKTFKISSLQSAPSV